MNWQPIDDIGRGGIYITAVLNLTSGQAWNWERSQLYPDSPTTVRFYRERALVDGLTIRDAAR